MPKTIPASTDTGLLLLRLWIGGVGVAHGTQKLLSEHGVKGFAGFLESMHVPQPQLSAWMAIAAELVGGLLIALGILPRLAAIPFAFTMLIAWLTAHHGAFFAQTGGGEYPLTLAVAALVILIAGPGRFSITGAKGL